MTSYRNKGIGAPVKLTDVISPRLLVSRDLNAFAVVRAYARALNEGNVRLAERLRVANQDLLPYFKYEDREWIRSSASVKVDQLEETAQGVVMKRSPAGEREGRFRKKQALQECASAKKSDNHDGLFALRAAHPELSAAFDKIDSQLAGRVS